MRYIYRKLLFYLAALWVAVTMNFVMPRLMPGNPAASIYAAHAMQFASNPHAMDTIKAELGLSNDPMPVQYWHYLGNLLHGDLGTSFTQYPVPVWTIISSSLPWTLFLVGMASILAFAIGTCLGIIAAWRRGGAIDTILPPITLFTQSVPPFWLGLILIYFLSFTYGWFPTSHAYDFDISPNFTLPFILNMLKHAILPAATLIVVTMGGWLLGMRNVMINTLAEDYVVMAEAKGLRDRRVMLRYAARNALLPQVTGFGMSLGYVVGGQVLIETIFSYQGVGFTLATAVLQEDYPLIQGLLLMIVICMLIANLAVDLLYARLDPRVRAT